MSGYSSERRLLQLVSRDAKAIIVLIEAYVDETGTNPGDVATCLAAYLIKPDQAALMSERWERVLRRYRIPFFHMTDCAHYQVCEPYKSLGRDRCVALATKLIWLIKQHCDRGVACCFNPNLYTLPDNEPTDNQYAFAVSTIIYHLQNFAVKYDREISYIFEAGHRHQSNARAVLDILLEQESATRKLFNYSFQTKTSATLLQAADILAWHCQTQIRRNRNGQGARKDFKSILQIPHDILHFCNTFDDKGNLDLGATRILHVTAADVDHPETIQEVGLTYDFGFRP